jgi:hypothetical protein
LLSDFFFHLSIMPLEHVFVDKKELQDLLNEAKYYDRVQTGEFKETYVYDEPPSPGSGQKGKARALGLCGGIPRAGTWRPSTTSAIPTGASGRAGSQTRRGFRIGDKLYIVKKQKDRWQFLFSR